MKSTKATQNIKTTPQTRSQLLNQTKTIRESSKHDSGQAKKQSQKTITSSKVGQGSKAIIQTPVGKTIAQPLSRQSRNKSKEDDFPAKKQNPSRSDSKQPKNSKKFSPDERNKSTSQIRTKFTRLSKLKPAPKEVENRGRQQKSHRSVSKSNAKQQLVTKSSQKVIGKRLQTTSSSKQPPTKYKKRETKAQAKVSLKEQKSKLKELIKQPVKRHTQIQAPKSAPKQSLPTKVKPTQTKQIKQKQNTSAVKKESTQKRPTSKSRVIELTPPRLHRFQRQTDVVPAPKSRQKKVEEPKKPPAVKAEQQESEHTVTENDDEDDYYQAHTEQVHAVSSDNDSEIYYQGGFCLDFHTQPKHTPSDSDYSSDEELSLQISDKVQPDKKSQPIANEKDEKDISSELDSYDRAPKKQRLKPKKLSTSPLLNRWQTSPIKASPPHKIRLNPDLLKLQQKQQIDSPVKQQQGQSPRKNIHKLEELLQNNSPVKQILRQSPRKNIHKPEEPTQFKPVFQENDILMDSDDHTNSDEDILELTQRLEDSPPNSVPFKANPIILKSFANENALFSAQTPHQNFTTLTELLPETLVSIQQVKQRRAMSPTGKSSLLEAPRQEHLSEQEMDEVIVEQVIDPNSSHTSSEENQAEQSVLVHNLSDQTISNEDLLETTSMRQKYRLQHKLALPTHFKHLFNLFCQLDTYLNLLKQRRKVTWAVTHSDICKMIEASMQRNFKISQFQQILTVCPNFFIHKWEHKQGKIELFIEIPQQINEILDCTQVEETEEEPFLHCLSDDLLQKRREQFSEELVAICYEHFNNVEMGSEDDSCYDAQSIRKWPQHFDVEQTPQLAEWPLKPQPQVHRQESFGNFLTKIDIRHTTQQQFAKGSLVEFQIPETQNNEEPASQQSYSSKLSERGVSQETINRICIMEQLEDSIRNRNRQIVDQGAQKRNIDDHIKMAETIYHLFKSKDKSTLQWFEIFESLKESNMGTFVEEKEYRSQLVLLSKIMSQWIGLISMPKTTLVKQLKKNMQTFELKEHIKHYFKEQQDQQQQM